MATSPIYSWPEPDNTDLVKNGALAIRTLGNAIDTTMGTMVAKTIIDAKGDLIAGTAADTAQRLAVGNNGETLVADSSTSSGLRWQSNFAAGKNKVINGDFGIWQRGTSFTGTSTGGFCADRLKWDTGSSGTSTVSQQTFTPGAAPVAGYEGQYFVRHNRSTAASSAGSSVLLQQVEDVRTFAGQTTTFSFWAKAGANKNFTAVIESNFGSGGSAGVTVLSQDFAVTTSWQRFTFTAAMPSISGKTIGTSSFIYLVIKEPTTAQTFTLDTWGWQWEASNTATAFQTATGTIQGELAACQRYYYGWTTGQDKDGNVGMYQSATALYFSVPFPVTMRTTPSVVATSGTAYYYALGSGGYDNFNSVTAFQGGASAMYLRNTTEAAGVAGTAILFGGASASASIAFSAEL